MDDALRERLIGLWDGRSQFVMDGSRHYQVQTPNGPKEPVFVPMQEGYGDVSTGFLKAPDPPKTTGPKKSAPKPKPAEESVTDVPPEGE